MSSFQKNDSTQNIQWAYRKNPIPVLKEHQAGPVGPKYYKPKKQEKQNPDSLRRKELLNKTWIKEYQDPIPGITDLERYFPENEADIADLFYPIRLIARNPDPSKNDTTYHSSFEDYHKFEKPLMRDQKYRNSEVFKDKQEAYKKEFEFFKGIWEEQERNRQK